MNNIKLPEIQIISETPFKNCGFERGKYADNLTQLLTNYADGFVLAINNAWGAGKTTFVKMWEQKLKNKGFKTIYFNAWENDFEGDALAAILGEIKPLVEKKSLTAFNKVVKTASVIGKNFPKILATAVVNKYVDSKLAGEIINSLVDGSMELFQKSLDDYQKKKEGISAFKNDFTDLVSNIRQDGKPLIFFIDEIDRCRPDYAVEVLEKVKHLFSVPGIVFVLSIDKAQLCNAIRGVYGSDKINAEEYLKRFIDVEYSLPDPDVHTLCHYMNDYFELDRIFDLDNNQRNEFQKFSEWLFGSLKFPIRTVEKLYCQTKLALCTSKIQYRFPALVLMMLYLKDHEPDFYQQMLSKEQTTQEISTNYFNIFKNSINVKAPGEFVSVHAQLVVLYSHSKMYNDGQLFNYDGTLKIDNVYDMKLFEDMINEFNIRYGDYNIFHIINMIELSDRFRF